MCVCVSACMCCVCMCVWGGGINTPEVIVSKFISNLIGFYSSFYRHALIQNFLGANLQSMYIHIYATFPESEERLTCRPTCRSCRYNSNLYMVLTIIYLL